MPQKLMLEQWNKFALMVIPTDASAIQRREMRRAFYAGAQMVLSKLMGELSPEMEETPEDLELMSEVYKELQDFAADVRTGKA